MALIFSTENTMNRQTQKEEALRGAMASLLPNPNFRHFLDAIRELREGAVSYAVSNTSVASDRECCAALGEVRAYSDILDIATAHESAIEHGLEEPGDGN